HMFLTNSKSTRKTTHRKSMNQVTTRDKIPEEIKGQSYLQKFLQKRVDFHLKREYCSRARYKWLDAHDPAFVLAHSLSSCCFIQARRRKPISMRISRL